MSDIITDSFRRCAIFLSRRPAAAARQRFGVQASKIGNFAICMKGEILRPLGLLEAGGQPSRPA
jgi:hypothetical protein